MGIEFIYTYKDEPQEIRSYDFDMSMLDGEESLVEVALSELSEEKKQQLVKVSCIINFYNGEPLPDWYKECKGKLWFENGVLA